MRRQDKASITERRTRFLRIYRPRVPLHRVVGQRSLQWSRVCAVESPGPQRESGHQKRPSAVEPLGAETIARRSVSQESVQPNTDAQFLGLRRALVGDA